MKPGTKELSIIQKTYDLIQWYVPHLNKLPKAHKFTLGDRIANRMYDLLEDLIKAKYARKKLDLLESINFHLDIIRYQSRMLLDFQLLSAQRYQYLSGLIDDIGRELRAWIKKQQERENQSTPCL
jgi:hypothetical protein